MKSRLFLLVLALMLAVDVGATPFHLRPRRRPIIRVPWQTVAAGGVAAGTMIAVYKISDGVEDGMKIAAKEKPEAFTDSLSVLTWPIRWAAFVLFLVSGCWIAKSLFELKSTSNRKDTTCNSH